MEQPQDLYERCVQYALRAIRLARAVMRSRDPAIAVISKQYLRSATSVGANIGEGKFGESRADFIHKYSIAQKEANECLYWLRLLQEADCITPERLKDLVDETRQILAIITSIIVKMKRT